MADAELFALPATIHHREIKTGVLHCTAGWKKEWGSTILGAALVPVAPLDPAAGDVRYCLAVNGLPVQEPKASQVTFDAQPFVPLAGVNPAVMPQLTWPAGADFAMLLVLLRSATDPNYVPPFMAFGASHAAKIAAITKHLTVATFPSAEEIRDAVAHQLWREIHREDGVIEVP